MTKLAIALWLVIEFIVAFVAGALTIDHFLF